MLLQALLNLFSVASQKDLRRLQMFRPFYWNYAVFQCSKDVLEKKKHKHRIMNNNKAFGFFARQFKENFGIKLARFIINFLQVPSAYYLKKKSNFYYTSFYTDQELAEPIAAICATTHIAKLHRCQVDGDLSKFDRLGDRTHYPVPGGRNVHHSTIWAVCLLSPYPVFTHWPELNQASCSYRSSIR